MASQGSNASLYPTKIRRLHVNQLQCKAHMWKSVCVHPGTLKIHRRNSFSLGTHFCQQNEHISVKIKDEKVNGPRAKLSIVSRILRVLNIQLWPLICVDITPTFIKVVNSVQTSHQPTCAQSEKTVWRLEIILRTTVIKKRAKYIPQWCR